MTGKIYSKLLSDLTSVQKIDNAIIEQEKKDFFEKNNICVEPDEDFISSLLIVQDNLNPICFRTLSICCSKSHTLAQYVLNYNDKSYVWDKMLSHTYECHYVTVNEEFIQIIKEIADKIFDMDENVINSIKIKKDAVDPIVIDHNQNKKPYFVTNRNNPKIQNSKIFGSYKLFLEELPPTDYVVDTKLNYDLLMRYDDYTNKNPFYIQNIQQSESVVDYHLLYGFLITESNLANLKKISLKSKNKYICSLTSNEIKKQIQLNEIKNDLYFFNFAAMPIPTYSKTLGMHIEILSNSSIDPNQAKKPNSVKETNTDKEQKQCTVHALFRMTEFENYFSSLQTEIPIRTNILVYKNSILSRFSSVDEIDNDTVYVYKSDNSEKYSLQLIDKLKNPVNFVIKGSAKTIQLENIHDDFYKNIQSYIRSQQLNLKI